ncbi:MAG: DNA polymerase III subunit beta, partial [Defluviitaleaceae bacterium]|nr:DNA polymerase III subunit beta [Defluviitaleaceae bacterium]
NVEQGTLVTCDRQSLLAGLERASLIAVKETRKAPVRIDISEDTLRIASNAQIGTVNEELDIDMDGNALQIGFNPRYLIDAMKAIDAEFVTLSFNSSLSPCIIKPAGDLSSKHLVLPLRLEA